MHPALPWIVAALLLLGAGLRLFDLSDQPIDFHPTRQLRGAIVARGIYYSLLPGADPRLQQQAVAYWNSTGQYEPSFLEALTALAALVTGADLIVLARVINTLFWLVGSLAVFALARRLSNNSREPDERVSPPPAADASLTAADIGALAALVTMLALPFLVQASRSFQPDPGMVMWLALFAWALFRWGETKSWKLALASGLFGGLAILTKAVALYPVALTNLLVVLSAMQAEPDPQPRSASGTGKAPALGRLVAALLSPQVWVMGALTVLPVGLFYLGRQGRASEYFDSWTIALSHLLLEPGFYLGWLDLAQQLYTPLALLAALAGAGLVIRRALRKQGPPQAGLQAALLSGLWAGYLLYGLFFPYQMDTHSYYHLPLAPIIALSLAPAAAWLAGWLIDAFHHRPALQRWRPLGWLAGVAALGALLAWLSWQALIPLYSADYRGEPAYWQSIAQQIPADGKVIALTQDYGYRLMYYGWRKVSLWPNRGEIKLSILRGSPKEFEDFFNKRTDGKDYFLITAFRQFEDQPELQQMLAAHYPLLAEGSGYRIYDLR